MTLSKITLKRIILSVLTLVALIPILLSLVSSFQEPQVQSDLQLYQTNLILQGSELDPEKFDLPIPRNTLLGDNTYELAEKQYKESEKSLQKNLDKLMKQKDKLLNQSSNNANSAVSELQKKIDEQIKNLTQVQINLGILQAKNQKITQAVETWNRLDKTENFAEETLLTTLKTIWESPQKITLTQKSLIEDKLSGWFRYQTLYQFYQTQTDNQQLALLETEEQILATQAITKLLTITLIPFITGAIGIFLLLFILIQGLFKKEDSLLAIHHQDPWEVPWKFETTWQVLVVGFFLVAQILLPLIFGSLGIEVSQLSLRMKAVYVLMSYLTMTAGGLLVLYFSIKPFFPLPSDWFQFKLNLKDLLWGIGGYLVALPLVVLISLVNQQIWQGQGGSNPLLSLALESQDKVVLAIFFFTASVAAPFFEEMMFRGFLLPALTRYFPVTSAIFMSGLIFAFAHLNLSEVLPLLVLGMVLGFVYTRSRNLLSSMVLHSLWNSGTLLSLFILGSSAK